MDQARVSGIAGDHAHALQSNIERALSATYSLAALVRHGQGSIPDFEATAGQMLPFYPGAASLQLALKMVELKKKIQELERRSGGAGGNDAQP